LHAVLDYNADNVKVRDLIKRLENDGGRLARFQGKPSSISPSDQTGTVTVAGHLSVDIPPGALNNILKQAGLK